MNRFPFYKDLSEGAKKLIEENAMEVLIPAGMELFAQGEQCSDILFLIDGSVRVYRNHISGQEITLYYLEPFEQCSINLNSVFTNSPATGTAVCDSNISAYMFSAPIIKSLYTSEPAYQQYIFELFSHRLENMASLVEDVRFKKMDERLLDWLKSQNSKIVKITHDKLSSHLGTSREVISRLLKEYERRDILELRRGEVKLK